MTLPGTAHPVDEVWPIDRMAAVALQHVLVMYAGAIAVPLIVGRALKLSPEQVALLMAVGGARGHDDTKYPNVGTENYFPSADGFLIPAKEDQPPPDLRYFNQSRK